jgi:hypothetical protein
MNFKLVQSNELIITPTGVAIIGAILNNNTNLLKRLNEFKIPEVLEDPEITNAEILKSYVALLCMGKSDFESIEEYRGNEFFMKALGINKVPSCSTLRQRLDMVKNKWNKIILEENVNLLKEIGVNYTPCYKSYIPLDIDVSPFDNSKTKKEGVSRTYKGCDGFAPIFAYLGDEGYCINMEFREGKVHCQKGTPEFLKQTLLYAKKATQGNILVRLDSGNDSADNIIILHNKETKADFIIKRNLRKEKLEEWLKTAKEKGKCNQPRDGKKVYIGETYLDIKGLENKQRVIFEVTERTIDKKGQVFMFPEVQVDTYWTSLSETPEEVIELYHNHGTSEQFHSEIKTDLDLERLPSGKFDTNSLVLTMGIFAYNILKIIGQESLKVDDAPARKKIKRRRLKTVIKNIITIASKLVKHAGSIKLNFGKCCSWFDTFKRIYYRFAIT